MTGLSFKSNFFCLSYREWMRGYHDLFRENPSSLFILLARSLIFIASCMAGTCNWIS
jgi:hypothetical protein